MSPAGARPGERESPLRRRIAALAEEFATEVIAAISSTLGEHFGRADRGPSPPGRPGRRSSVEIEALAGRILAALGKQDGGLLAEKLRAGLGVSRAELARPLARLLSDGRIRKTGSKRRTTYFVAPPRKPARPEPARERPVKLVAARKVTPRKAPPAKKAAPAKRAPARKVEPPAPPA